MHWYLLNLVIAALASAAVQLAPEELKRIFLFFILIPIVQVQRAATGAYIDRSFKIWVGAGGTFFAVVIGYICAQWWIDGSHV